ncbi:MAG: LysM peptidoglycan-binding domain-containing M23 family metallopeptidase [Chloroflexi bacterium]|nr:LysM peptidoglycan-binding domain-containing M23 family metallopeptidase [Chloroflexota bacterium]
MTTTSRLISIFAWIIALMLAAAAGVLAWRRYQAAQAALPQVVQQHPAPAVSPKEAGPAPALPQVAASAAVKAVGRKATLRTIIPNRPTVDIVKHTVSIGDSLFEIAQNNKIKPETVLWANYSLLNDNPDLISVGMELNLPPVDGVFYEWQEGDTLEAVAGRFEASVEDILSWSGNQLDLTNPQVEPGAWIMVPGGHREFRQWVIPVIPRGRAGVSKSVYGAGACDGGYDGAYGSGAFIWPAGNHYLSGNDYWSGHLGIDIAAGEGAPVYAADSGVVVFSGWATGGYGYMVMVDHGNGYQTLYAHLSNATAYCGQSVGQGSTIGVAGSTGNSTGAHLHFEVRYEGGFINPWYVLPAP